MCGVFVECNIHQQTWCMEYGTNHSDDYNPFPLLLTPPQMLKTRVHLQLWKFVVGQFDF